MAGGGMQFIGEKLGIQPMAEAGQELKDWAAKKGDEWFGEVPEEGLERIVYLGSQMLAPSIIPGAAATTGLRALFGIGKLVKEAKAAGIATAEGAALVAQAGKMAKTANQIGSATAASMFGVSQAQQTVDNIMKRADALEKEGKTEEAAAMRENAKGLEPLVTGAIEAAGEYLGTAR